jgi:hypothetical protein
VLAAGLLAASERSLPGAAPEDWSGVERKRESLSVAAG